MKPKLADYQTGSTSWVNEYKNIRYKLNHHGIKSDEYMEKYENYDSPNEGIWCYYIYLPENMFEHTEEFAQFNLEADIKFGYSTYYETYPYENIPDLDFYSGITFYAKRRILDHKTGLYIWNIEIGCDYNHSWDHESRFWQDKNAVERDCKRTIDTLISQFSILARCKYNGKIDKAENFYTVKSGQQYHIGTISEYDKPIFDHGHYEPIEGSGQKFIDEYNKHKEKWQVLRESNTSINIL